MSISAATTATTPTAAYGGGGRGATSDATAGPARSQRMHTGWTSTSGARDQAATVPVRWSWVAEEGAAAERPAGVGRTASSRSFPETAAGSQLFIFLSGSFQVAYALQSYGGPKVVGHLEM
ncbi:MAG: hypothetical protein HYT12_02655 [Candidatus Liptonbacteria bacterium]|nr:hypothetical protein [Candidatus Liptonbacteria bacterium]